MSLTYQQAYERSYDGAFVGRVASAIVTVARDVAAELASTTHHDLRAPLATQVLLDPWNWARRMAVGVSVDKASVDAPTDADLYSSASALWNGYAGVVTS